MSKHITIFSVMAASDRDRFPTAMWEGEVESDDLEDIFRAFNRVDEEDATRLEEIGYKLPSLSVGDIVVRETDQQMVASCGFREVSTAEVLKIVSSSDPWLVAKKINRGDL